MHHAACRSDRTHNVYDTKLRHRLIECLKVIDQMSTARQPPNMTHDEVSLAGIKREGPFTPDKHEAVSVHLHSCSGIAAVRHWFAGHCSTRRCSGGCLRQCESFKPEISTGLSAAGLRPPGHHRPSPALLQDDDGLPKLCQGTTAAKVLIDSVLPYPPEGSKQPQTIVLRNFGGQVGTHTEHT